MRIPQQFTILFAVTAALALAACSGGKNSGSSSTTTTTTTTQSSPGAMAPGSPAAMAPGSSAAAGSATMSCAGGERPVWANTRTHVYHLPSDPMYGQTKHGKYMCKSDAIAAGYHAAGSRRHHHTGGANGAQAQPSPSPGM